MEQQDKEKMLSAKENYMKEARQLTDAIKQIPSNIPVKVETFKRSILPMIVSLRDGGEINAANWVKSVGHPKIGVDVVDDNDNKILELPPLFYDTETNRTGVPISYTLSELSKAQEFGGVDGHQVHQHCYEQVSATQQQEELAAFKCLYMLNRALDYFGEKTFVVTGAVRERYDAYLKEHVGVSTDMSDSEDADADDVIFQEELL